MTSRSLVQSLPEGPIDVIGDIHGEYDALISILSHLGYDVRHGGKHPEGRKAVFVGDLVDRGPDSPAVVKLVKRLVESGNAYAVLGNHELNLLRNKPKDGAGWYFDERYQKDAHYQPFQLVSEDDRQVIYDFLSNLPLVLERSDLRVVHAAWSPEHVEYARNIKAGDVVSWYSQIEKDINAYISESGLLQRYHAEKDCWDDVIEVESAEIPFLYETAAYNVAHQMRNPLRVLTSGVERQAAVPFYASHKWRYVERVAWWNEYTEDVSVIVGHYWRRIDGDATRNKDETNVFENVSPTSWHGARGNVFCVDFSVGGRYKERNRQVPLGTETALVALRWPERTLMMEDGAELDTSCYGTASFSLNECNL